MRLKGLNLSPMVSLKELKVAKKDLLPSEMERMVNAANKKVVAGGGKRMSLSQLRKAGKINF